MRIDATVSVIDARKLETLSKIEAGSGAHAPDERLLFTLNGPKVLGQ